MSRIAVPDRVTMGSAALPGEAGGTPAAPGQSAPGETLGDILHLAAAAAGRPAPGSAGVPPALMAAFLLVLLLALLAGCSLPGAGKLGAPPPAAARQAATFDLQVKLALRQGERQVQFNGGYGALQNDVAKLVVGIFDNGTTTAPAMGYLYTGGATGSATTAALGAGNAPHVATATPSIADLLGTAGTGAAASGLAITGNKGNLRRYAIWDFGDGAGLASELTDSYFTNVPVAAGDGVHRYLVFAAAYNSTRDLLGYTEAAIPDASTQGGSTAAPQLTLHLKKDVFVNALSASPSLVPVVTGASASFTTPLLAAVHQPVASAGSTVYLEGQFTSPRVTVNFPGGVSADATVLGSRRARVAVPAGATAGDLTFSIAGNQSNALPFRVPSFTVRFGTWTFTSRFDQAGYASQMPKLATGRYNFGTAVAGSYLYVIGGSGPSSILSSIERATINADGTLGPFSAVGNLLTGRFGAASAVAGNYLYVMAGNASSGRLSSVERATINADGTLGAFSVVGNIGTARYNVAGAVVGNNLYVIGGYDGSNKLTSIEGAAIQPDGSLGTFAVAGNLATARMSHRAAVIGKYLYVVGGYGSAALTSVERATINGDGSLGSFASVSDLGVAREMPAIAIVGNDLYVAGGYDGVSYATMLTTERAPINADGTLGAFAGTTNLTVDRMGHALARVANHLYAFGGTNPGGYPVTVERMSINASGNLGTFADAGVALAAPRGAFGLALAWNKVYVIGGYDNVSALGSVERASVAADGTLGAFQAEPSVTLGTARHSLGSAVVADYLYVLGGYLSGTGFLNSVERASAAGSLSSFSNAGVTLATARQSFRTAVIGNYLYVIGGQSGVGDESSVERATINADGSLGGFATVSGVTLGTARFNLGSAISGSYLHVFGGYGGGSPLNTVERATIDGSGNLGSFGDAGVTLATARNSPCSAVIGNYLYVFGGQDGSGNVASVERASIDSAGNLGAFQTVSGISLAAPRRFAGSAAVGNYLYLLGGYTSSYTTSVERAVLQ